MLQNTDLHVVVVVLYCRFNVSQNLCLSIHVNICRHAAIQFFFVQLHLFFILFFLSVGIKNSIKRFLTTNQLN